MRKPTPAVPVRLEDKMRVFLADMHPVSLRWATRPPLRMQDAEDVFQDTAMAFWRSLQRKGSSIDPFQYESLWWRILRHRAVSAFRRLRVNLLRCESLDAVDYLGCLPCHGATPLDGLWKRDL